MTKGSGERRGERMRKATSESHPTAAELFDGATSLIRGMKLLNHVRGCEMCLSVYSEIFSRFSDSYISGFWRDEGLSEKVTKALTDSGIYSLSELEAAHRRKIPGIGRKGAREIRDLLDRHKKSDSD